MVMLCTLADAKAQIQIDHNLSDAEITDMIEAASGAVLAYLKRDVSDIDSDGSLVTDSDGVIEMEPQVKQATKYLIGVFFRDRDGADIERWAQGYLPWPVIGLLTPLRDPSLA